MLVQRLVALGNIWQGNLLTIAPELELTGQNIGLLMSNNVRFFNAKSWSSVWMDIRIDIITLRANLNGKWRSKLVVAEKNGMQVESGSTPELMDWMIARYQENMAVKGFEGISIPLLRSIYDDAGDDCPLLIFRALYNDSPIAGLCIACHGIAATYLVGWSGFEGRQLKANHFQLWQAITILKDIGIQWFDLGGVDEEATPGVSEFKLGMGGETYDLVGDGWRINVN